MNGCCFCEQTRGANDVSRMPRTYGTEAFEDTLLAHVEMCYSVALTLTRNPVKGESLAREVLTWAWQLPDNAKNSGNIKFMLLTEMRERYRNSRDLKWKESPLGKPIATQ